jgi:hypothetical protein
MQILRHPFLILSAPLLMAAVAVGRMEPVVGVQSDEADAQVERVIKAAMDMRIDEAPVLDLKPKSTSQNGGLYLGGQLSNLTGDATPEESLAGQLRTIVDSPRVELSTRVDSYRLGYRYPIASGQEADALLPVSIHSLMGVAVLDAKLEGADGFLMEHGFLKGAPLMGVETEWRATRQFSVAGEMTSTVPLSSMPWILSGQVLGRHQLLGRPDRGLRAFAGVGYERILVQDQNEAIGDINSDSGPMLILGIEARF